jgi:hypothetical protein
MIEEVTVTSVQELLTAVEQAYGSWETKSRPWFRGEAREASHPLLPKLLRSPHNELQLLKQFRIEAPTYVNIQIPQRGHTDQWLFLAQHVGLPTRLLDWTEGLLAALHFAAYSRDPGAVVWMLDPIALNEKASGKTFVANDFPITWFSPELDVKMWIRKLLAPDDRARGESHDYRQLLEKGLAEGKIEFTLGNRNIRAAWENDSSIATELPVAVKPTAIHPRITVQRAAFTIWGSKPSPLHTLVGSRILRKFVIEDGAIESVKFQLQLLGVSWSTLFPDLDHLARDLELRY